MREEVRRTQHDAWAAQKVIRFGSQEFDDAVTELPTNDCIPSPPGAESFAFRELSQQQQTDLSSALRGLLLTFADYSPDALVSYMKERGETLDGQATSGMKKILVREHGFAESLLSSMSAQETLLLFWDRADLQTHWEGLLADSSCVRLWRIANVNPMTDKALRETLGQTDRDIWQGYARHRHIFVGNRSVDDVLREHGTVLCADVKVSVKHDAAHRGEVAPYHFRFCYDPLDEKWHPVDMVRMVTFADAPRKILF
jgi:hypothetical protein